jgi:ubiquitin-protein ligase
MMDKPDAELQTSPHEQEPLLPELQSWASENDPRPEVVELYERVLGCFRFNTFNMAQDGTYLHSMAGKVGSIEELQAKARRFNNEIKAFTHGLPCHASSAIFVVMDETRMDLIKALISGPEDSPYEHGLYLFDILCPGSYPDMPPLVSIMTTGEGSVRFNPNLYDSGYVCLSIINTWDSMPEEMWNPQQSNLLQVLVSIQALVMDEFIIQKEPYYETLEKDSVENRAYADIVRYNNAKWAILDILRRPPQEFKSVVFRHFALKKAGILRTLDRWVEEAAAQEKLDYYSVDCLVSEHNHPTCEAFMEKGGYIANLIEVVQQIKEELRLLPDFTDPEQLEAALAEYEIAHEVRRLKLEEQLEAQAEAQVLSSHPPEAAGIQLVGEAEEAKYGTIVVESQADLFKVKPLAPPSQLMTVNKLEAVSPTVVESQAGFTEAMHQAPKTQLMTLSKLKAISPKLVESQAGLIEAKLTILEPQLMAYKPEVISPIIAESHAEFVEAMLLAPQTHSMTVNKLEPISPVVQAPEVETEDQGI